MYLLSAYTFQRVGTHLKQTKQHFNLIILNVYKNDNEKKKMLRGVIDTQYKGGTYLTLEAYLKRGGADPGRHTPQYQPYLSTNGLHAKGE